MLGSQGMAWSGAAGCHSLDITQGLREAGRGDMEWGLDRVLVSSGAELWRACMPGINCKGCSDRGLDQKVQKMGCWRGEGLCNGAGIERNYGLCSFIHVCLYLITK